MLAQTRSLAHDVGDLVAMRVELVRVELVEELDERLSLLARKVLIGGALGVATLFLLLGAAFGLGTLLGHVAWGFLTVGGGLSLGAAAVAIFKPDFVRLDNVPRVARHRLEPQAEVNAEAKLLMPESSP